MDMDRLATPLLNGEKLVWTGRPRTGLLLTSRDAVLVPFSLLWGGFAIFWTVTAHDAGAPWFFSLWGSVFAGIGLYMIGGRFLADAWLRGGTIYAVTDRRIVIERSRPFPKRTVLLLDRLPEMSLTTAADGSGSIRFGSELSPWSWQGQHLTAWTPSLDPTPQFLAIPDAALVFQRLQRLVDASKRPIS